jgi:hypothetical protein
MHVESHLEVIENKEKRKAKTQCRFREIEEKSGMSRILSSSIPAAIAVGIRVRDLPITPSKLVHVSKNIALG